MSTAAVVQRGLQYGAPPAYAGWFLVGSACGQSGPPPCGSVGQWSIADHFVEFVDPGDVVAFHATRTGQIGFQAVADRQAPVSSRRAIKDITSDVCFPRGPDSFRVSSRTRSCAELLDIDGLRPAGACAISRTDREQCGQLTRFKPRTCLRGSDSATRHGLGPAQATAIGLIAASSSRPAIAALDRS